MKRFHKSTVFSFSKWPFKEKCETVFHVFLLLKYKLIVSCLPYSSYRELFKFGKPTDQVGKPPILRDTQNQAALRIKNIHLKVKRFIPWKGSFCLVNALAISARFRRLKIPHRMMLGVKKEKGTLKAHAWLTSGSFAICGVKEASSYKTVGVFETFQNKPQLIPAFLKKKIVQNAIAILMQKRKTHLCLPTYFQRKALRVALNYPRNYQEDSAIYSQLTKEPNERWLRTIVLLLDPKDSWEKQHPDLKRKVQNLQEGENLKNLSIYASLSQVQTLFSKAEIPMIVLKGVAMITRFKSRPYHREVSDWDALIPKSKLSSALHNLAQKEMLPIISSSQLKTYFQTSHALAIQKKHHRSSTSSNSIDLHLSVFKDRIGKHSFEDIHQNAQTLTQNGRPITIPCDELLLLMCISHGLEYKIRRDFRWLVDAAIIIQETEKTLEWEKVIRLAITHQKRLALKHGLKILRLTTKQPIPQNVFDALALHDQALTWEGFWLWLRLLPSTKLRTFLRKTALFYRRYFTTA